MDASPDRLTEVLGCLQRHLRLDAEFAQDFFMGNGLALIIELCSIDALQPALLACKVLLQSVFFVDGMDAVAESLYNLEMLYSTGILYIWLWWFV